MLSRSLSPVVGVLLAATIVSAMNTRLWLICIWAVPAPALIHFASYMFPIQYFSGSSVGRALALIPEVQRSNPNGCKSSSFFFPSFQLQHTANSFFSFVGL
jgi:hypothetical protein